MAKKRSPYSLIYAPEALEHVRGIERKYHGLLKEGIRDQLTYEPFTKTTNRKPLERLPGPGGSTWELRLGPDNRFRVFYSLEGENVVQILVMGTKDGNKLLIAGKEFKP